MLIATAHFNALALIPLTIALGPVIYGIVWTRRHAGLFRGLSASMQVLIPFAMVGWMLLVGIPSLNYRAWVDTADVWVIREGQGGIVKEEMKLIGATDYRFAGVKKATIRADAAHYQMIVNDSTRTIGRRSVFYGKCPPDSPYTLTAVLGREADLDIPPGSVADNPSFGYFGVDPDRPPKEITVTRLRPDIFDYCEGVSWYAPVAPVKPSPRSQH